MAISSQKQSIVARLSVVLSSVCVIHCLSVPIVIMAMPFIADFFTDTVELILVLSILPLGIAGFVPVWLKHKNARLLTLFVISIAIILAAQFIFHTPHEMYSRMAFWSSEHFISMATKPFLTLLGALGLAYATYKNNYHTHVCTNKNHVHG